MHIVAKQSENSIASVQAARFADGLKHQRGNKPISSATGVLRELWRSRDLVYQFVLRDLTIRYVQAVMGFAWALLMPVLIVGAGVIFRLVVSTLSGKPMEGSSVASLAVKALPWAFFSGAISLSTQSILAHANLIGKIYFPRESLPIASVLAQSVDLLIGLAIVLLVIPFLGVNLGLTALWGLPVMFALMLFTVGCALIFSCANLFFRDVKYLVQVVLNFGVFATPVFFEPQLLGPVGSKIMMRLPLSPFIEAIDLAVVHNTNLLHPVLLMTPKGMVEVWAPWMLVYMAALSIGCFWAGLRVFRSASAKFAEMA